MIKIEAIKAFNDNYIWYLSNDKYAAVVDPGDAAPVSAKLESNQTLTDIIITHHHFDHTGGVLDLVKKWPNAKVHGPKKSSIKFFTDTYVSDDICELKELNIKLNIMETPGHTLDHICYFNDEILFCGDTLFAAGCGRLFEGSAEQMHNSLLFIKQLPLDINIYPAHEYTLDNLRFAHSVEPENQDIVKLLQNVTELRDKDKITLPTTLKQELATNPFLRTNVAALHSACTLVHNLDTTNEVALFSSIRKMKDNFKYH